MENNTNFSKNFSTAVVMTLIALFVIKYFNISYPVSIVNTSRTTEMSVVGEGKVEVVPDTAYINVGITVNSAKTVSEAQKTMNDTNNKIIAAMAELGIDKKDIKTSNYSIYPNYSYENNVNRISGYNGNATIEIKARDPQMASQVTEAAISAGANEVQGSRFVVDKPETYREQAREEAIKNAREQAQKLAKNLGIKLGRVVNIVESSPNMPVAYDLKMAARPEGGGGGGPSIEPGSQTITSVVTLYFEKK